MGQGPSVYSSSKATSGLTCKKGKPEIVEKDEDRIYAALVDTSPVPKDIDEEMSVGTLVLESTGQESLKNDSMLRIKAGIVKSDPVIILKEPLTSTEQEPVMVNGMRQKEQDHLLSFSSSSSPLSAQRSQLPDISEGPHGKVKLLKLVSPQEGPHGKGENVNNVQLDPAHKRTSHGFVKDEVQLRRAENAWRPAVRNQSGSQDPESQETQEVFRKIRSILNKLTPEKYSRLHLQVMGLSINTQERIEGIVQLVYQKAVDEPGFAEIYAKLCHSLAMMSVSRLKHPSRTMNFQTVLLDHCEAEFKNLSLQDDVIREKEQELKTVSDDERERLLEDLKEAKAKAHRRAVNSMRFTGELFKLGMLMKTSMHGCVVKMLEKRNELNLECLCKLLTTAGKQLDDDKVKVDHYINEMSKIVKRRKTSSRIRFMLQDVIDLRLHKWVPRRANQGPKTIEQVRRDAQMEKEEEQRKVYEQLQNMRLDGSDPSLGNLKPPLASPSFMILPDDWSKKLTSLRLLLNDEPQRLEPTWMSLSLWGPARKPDQAANYNYELVHAEELAADTPVLSEEQMKTHCKFPIKEFLRSDNYKVTVQWVDEFQQSSMLYVFVQIGVKASLEKSQVARDRMGRLFLLLLTTGRLTKPQFFNGFMAIFESTSYLALNVPHLWLCLAEVLVPVLCGGGITMKELYNHLRKSSVPVECVGKLFAEILHLPMKHADLTNVGNLWRDSELTVNDLFSEEYDDMNGRQQIQEFKTAKKRRKLAKKHQINNI